MTRLTMLVTIALGAVLSLGADDCELWIWGPPTRLVVEAGPPDPSNCQVTTTYTYAMSAEYAWCASWYVDCDPVARTVQFCDYEFGTGERVVEGYDIPGGEAHLAVASWDWAKPGEPYNSKVKARLTFSDYEGAEWRVYFEATLTAGWLHPCPGDLVKSWHTFPTGHKETGTQYGWLCCPTEEPCAQWAP